jgi:methionyl-tRNA formyltransferase
MRIAFIGAVEFSLKAIEATIQAGGDVVAVCTLKESSFNSDFCDLSGFAASNRIPSLYAEDINSAQTITWLKQQMPDIIFCFGWSRLLKKDLLTLSPMGVVGFHPAALPQNRGRHPIIWALALGLEQTAATFFFMDVGADSGDILSQRFIAIDASDDARSLYDKIVRTATEQISEFVPRLRDRTFTRIKQDHSVATTWRKRGASDGLIDWRMSARTIHNLVRALAKPYIGAEFRHGGEVFKVWKSGLVADYVINAEPGKVLQVSERGPVVKCGEGALQLCETEPKLAVAKGDYL